MFGRAATNGMLRKQLSHVVIPRSLSCSVKAVEDIMTSCFVRLWHKHSGVCRKLLVHALVEGQSNRCKERKKLNASCVWRMVHVVLRNRYRDNPQLNQTIYDYEMLVIHFIVHEFQMQFSLSKERNNITPCLQTVVTCSHTQFRI